MYTKKIKYIALFLSCVLTFQNITPLLYAKRASNMVAPTINVPEFTIQVPTDMPSAFENLGDKYNNSKQELTQQGWGENNYKDGLANKLEAPKGFGAETGEDIFYAKYGEEVMNKDWMAFGLQLYSEEKFLAQKQLVAQTYTNYWDPTTFATKAAEVDSKHSLSNAANKAENALNGQYGNKIEDKNAEFVDTYNNASEYITQPVMGEGEGEGLQNNNNSTVISSPNGNVDNGTQINRKAANTNLQDVTFYPDGTVITSEMKMNPKTQNVSTPATTGGTKIQAQRDKINEKKEATKNLKPVISTTVGLTTGLSVAASVAKLGAGVATVAGGVSMTPFIIGGLIAGAAIIGTNYAIDKYF